MRPLRELLPRVAMAKRRGAAKQSPLERQLRAVREKLTPQRAGSAMAKATESHGGAGSPWRAVMASE